MIIGSNRSVVFKKLAELKERTVNQCVVCHGADPGCRCHALMLMYEAAAAANVPAKFWSIKTTDFGVGQEQNPVVSDLKSKWIKLIFEIENTVQNIPLIVVSGPNGTGKTMMASILLKSAATVRGISPQYILFNQLISLHYSKEGNKDEILERLHACDLLVIDEFGKEYTKTNQFGEIDTTSSIANYAKFVAENILKTRSDASLTTVIITNDTIDELKSKYGGPGRSVDSILAASSTVTLHHAGIDFRKGKI